jgi:hypothetical protein
MSKRSREVTSDEESQASSQKRTREGRSRQAGAAPTATYKRGIGRSAPAEDKQFLKPNVNADSARLKASQRARSRVQEFSDDDTASVMELGVRGMALQDDAGGGNKAKKGKARMR